MKRRGPSSSPSKLRLVPRGAGAGTGRKPAPTPGWKPRSEQRRGWKNPRPPSVPSSLDINLEEYYAGATLLGLLASQSEEPNKRWCRDWSFQMGEIMAACALRRRRKASRR